MTDPLTEARDALRFIHECLEDARYDDMDAGLSRCTTTLARLNALPAPIRCDYTAGSMPLFVGWGYPDAEETT